MPKYIRQGIQSVTFQDSTNCPLCEFTTHSKTALKLHLKFVHKKKETNFNIINECSKCSEKFDTKKELNNHIKKHITHIKNKKL